MAIRNIAHSIRAGEISLGVAVGVESMSLKSVTVPLVRNCRRVRLASPSVLILFISQSPSHSLGSGRSQRKPTGARLHPGALLLGSSRSWKRLLNNDDDRAPLLAAHGVDLGNGRSNVRHFSAEAGRVRAHFSHARSKGKRALSLSFFIFARGN